MARDPKPATILAATLAKESRNASAYQAARDAEALIALGKRAARIAEQRCNGVQRWDSAARQYLATWTEDDDAKSDKASQRIEAKALEILKPYGGKDAKAHGDPRGYVLSFRLKSGASNGWDSGRWGV